jgi:hypothetical protein
MFHGQHLYASMLTIFSLLSARCIKIVYPTPPAYLAVRKKLESYVNDLFLLIKSGTIKINVHCVYFLEDVAKAHSVCIFNYSSLLPDPVFASGNMGVFIVDGFAAYCTIG